MLKLVKLDPSYHSLLIDMMDEWTATGESIIPMAIGKCDYRNYDTYAESLEVKEDDGKYVPDSTFFLLDTERNIFLGAVNIRHYLSERLFQSGGHIGVGIRPSERNKGYGTKIVELALLECDKLNINKILMCCNKTNIVSAKTIISNGGVLENEIDCNGTIIQRYWITRKFIGKV